MKKYVVFFAAVLMLAGVMMLTGCGSQDENLVGTWVWNDNPASITTLNADGTGTHTTDWGYGLTFRWSTRGNDIHWNYPGHPNMRTGYTVSGDSKTWIMDGGLRVNFTRVP